MGRQVSRDSLPEEGSFVWMEGGEKQAARCCLLLPAAAPMKSSSYLQCFEKTDDHFHRYGDKIVRFDPYVAL